MTIMDYRVSQRLSSEPFYALLMAAMRQADNDNLEKLKQAFPAVFDELTKRYNAPGGALTDSELAWVTRIYEAEEVEEAE